jgi:splicing factor 3A subunit 3
MLSFTPISKLDELQQHHQLLETTRDLIYEELTNNVPKTIPQSIVQEARVSSALKRQTERAKNIARIYQDENNDIKKLIQRVDCPDIFSHFYKDLEQIRQRHGDAPAIAISLSTIKEKLKDEIFQENVTIKNQEGSFTSSNLNLFSGEEHRGRFIDMITVHREYLNLTISKSTTAKPVSYVEYLENAFFATSLEQAKLQTRNNRAYQRYVNNLLACLKQYIRRIQPIHSVEILHNATSRSTTKVLMKDSNSIDDSNTIPKLSTFKSVEELEKIDGNVLKQMLHRKKMKQGGTIKERAERLWFVKDMKDDEIPKKFIAKIRKKRKKENGNNNSSNAISNSSNKSTLTDHTLDKEFLIQLLAQFILDRLHSTVQFLRRKQTRSYTEVLKDLEEEEMRDAMMTELNNGTANNEKDEDEDAIVYNPKNVPLGFDGKPIPYWMYKLHGFDKHFTCQICGNETYTGPKIFEKHFSEGRHSMGMATLNIPNTKEYYGLTKIEEVVALHKKLTSMNEKQIAWNNEEDEEFEDSDGNVMSKETYENLKRNGLL